MSQQAEGSLGSWGHQAFQGQIDPSLPTPETAAPCGVPSGVGSTLPSPRHPCFAVRAWTPLLSRSSAAHLPTGLCKDLSVLCACGFQGGGLQGQGHFRETPGSSWPTQEAGGAGRC